MESKNTDDPGPGNGCEPPSTPAGTGVADVIARRVSCRSYKPDAVPQGHLLRILEAARLAPSACNKQPWRFAVVRDPELRRRIVEEGFLPGINMPWALGAPVHVVVGMEETSFLTHRLGAKHRVGHAFQHRDPSHFLVE